MNTSPTSIPPLTWMILGQGELAKEIPAPWGGTVLAEMYRTLKYTEILISQLKVSELVIPAELKQQLNNRVWETPGLARRAWRSLGDHSFSFGGIPRDQDERVADDLVQLVLAHFTAPRN